MQPRPRGVGHPWAPRVPLGRVRVSLVCSLHAPLPQRAPAALPGVPARAGPSGGPSCAASVRPSHTVRPRPSRGSRPGPVGPQRPRRALTPDGRQSAQKAEEQHHEGGPARHAAPGAAQPQSPEWLERVATAGVKPPRGGARGRGAALLLRALAPPAATPTQRPGMWARGAGRGRAASPRRPRCRNTTPTLLGKV